MNNNYSGENLKSTNPAQTLIGRYFFFLFLCSFGFGATPRAVQGILHVAQYLVATPSSAHEVLGIEPGLLHAKYTLQPGELALWSLHILFICSGLGVSSRLPSDLSQCARDCAVLGRSLELSHAKYVLLALETSCQQPMVC